MAEDKAAIVANDKPAQMTQREREAIELHELEKSAGGKVITSSGLHFLAAIGAFGVLFQAGFLVAGGVSGLLLFSGIKRAIKAGQNAVFMRNEERFAHLLNDGELIRLTKIVGKEEVCDHILYALDRGLEITGDAEDYLKSCGKRTEPLSISEFLTEHDGETVETTAQAVEGVMSDEEIAQLEAYRHTPGVNTQLHAIDVSASDDGGSLNISGATSLIKFLQSHEKGWLWDLIDQAPRQEGREFRVLMPIMIVGAAGSYKSYLGAYIALARALLNGHRIEINDPHGHKNRRKAWSSLLAAGGKLFGSNGNYGEIAEKIGEFINVRCKEAGDDETPKFTPIWDELTNYGAMPATKGCSELLLRMQASDARKLGECPIVITHNDTNTALGGSQGMQSAIARGFIKIRLDVDQVKGIPLFKGVIEYPENSRGEQEIKEISFNPDWLHPEKLLLLLKPDAMTTLRSVKNSNPDLPEKDLIEAQYQAEKALRVKPSPKMVIPSIEELDDIDPTPVDETPIKKPSQTLRRAAERSVQSAPQQPEELSPQQISKAVLDRLIKECENKARNLPDEPDKWWVTHRWLSQSAIARKHNITSEDSKQFCRILAAKAKYEMSVLSAGTPNESIRIRIKPSYEVL